MIDLICFGELLWDLLPSGKVIGGAPFNIVNRAGALGLQAKVISSIGQDALGDELLSAVQKLGCDINYIQNHADLPTSTVIIEVNQNGEPFYNIIYPVAWDDIVLTPPLIGLLHSARAMVYSSLGLRDPRSREVLFSLLPHSRLKICDVNLRQGHYEKETIMKMLESADILRMNEAELNQISLWLNIDDLTPEDQVKHIFYLYRYQEIIVTLGGKGAMAYDGNELIVQQPFSIGVKDTVGAGDAFLSAYIQKRLSQKGIREALRFGCALGALTASKHGGTPDIQNSEIEKLLNDCPIDLK